MTDEEFYEYVATILRRELGPYGMARILRTYRSGSGDYTRDRHKWLDKLTIDEIPDESQCLDNLAAE
jgi:hypothetical protein